MSAGDARAGELLDSAYDTLAAELDRRRDAAWRHEPLTCGRRDPLDRPAARRGPSDFAMTRAELSAEVERCRAAGWRRWELVERLADPRTVAAA